MTAVLHARVRTLLVVAAALLVPVVVAPSPAAADHSIVTDRVAGEDRFDTAARVALRDYPDGVSRAIVARGDVFADALSASALSGHADAPILLTRTNELPDVTAGALQDLGVAEVYVLGGAAAVSAQVEERLAQQHTVARLGGDDRYDTAAAIAAELDRFRGDADTPDGPRAYLARGDVPFDALAAGAPAAASDAAVPVLLTASGHLPAATRMALQDTGTAHVTIVGGTTAVSPAVAEELARLGISTDRLAGGDRYQTAIAIAEHALATDVMHAATVVLTRGDDFADALAAGPFAGNTYGPVVLTDPAVLPGATRAWLDERCGSTERVVTMGGPAAVSGDVVELAVREGTVCHGEPADADGLLERGETGDAVLDLQQDLQDLGYWVGPTDGVYGQLTEQAVFAFQKVNRLTRDGVFGPSTREAMADPRAPQARSTSGYVVEVDEARQVLKLVDDGQVHWVFNTSTGTEEEYTYEGETYLADTPNGQWQIYRQIDGWRTSHLGELYRPKYFHEDGIAIHGYHNVPPYPASHGCVRVTIEAIDWLWATDRLPIHTTVLVY